MTEPRAAPGFNLKPDQPPDSLLIAATFERYSQAHLAYIHATRAELKQARLELELTAQAHRNAVLG